ncbi:MAG: hypothetical protein E5X58_42610, partial [Mesorhizobium sp.]
AWPFGSPDIAGDIIHKGAFAKSAAMPIMFEHDPDRIIGNWETVEETDDGLQVKADSFWTVFPALAKFTAAFDRAASMGSQSAFGLAKPKPVPVVEAATSIPFT